MFSMKQPSAVAIIGPNTVGKTAVASELARRVGGEVINLDKVYLFRHFPISSGLADALKEKGVKRHLYELLEPDENIIPAKEYANMLRTTSEEILGRGALPILEGGSTTYVPAFFEENQRKAFCDPIIGLRPASNIDHRERIVRRIEIALKDGVVDEIAQGLKKYRNTLFMTDGHFAIPLVRYLDGKIDLETAKEQIVELTLQYAKRQREMFSQYPDVIWLEHDPSQVPSTVKKVIDLLQGTLNAREVFSS